MLGHKDIVDIQNFSIIGTLKKDLQIKNGKHFFGGSMFWMRMTILRKYFNSENLNYYYQMMESGYRNDTKEPQLEHAFERILGYIVEDSGLEIKELGC